MKRIEDISDILTEQAFQKLNKGQVLVFNQEGEQKYYRIIRLNKKLKKCFVISTKLHDLNDEVVKGLK